MSNFAANISIEDVLEQNKIETAPKAAHFMAKGRAFDVKNYLQARLGKNEKSKTLCIRLLPFDLNSGVPFHKVHFHNVQVSKEVSPNGWKQFPCPVKNKLGDRCPFCEMAKKANELKKSATTESEKKMYYELEAANTAKEMWVVRCIERGHEEDGVKFWLFTNSKKHDGVYDKIINIFQNRYNRAKEQGKENNIFDLNDGKDLIVTLTKDSEGRTVTNITDDDDKSPLSTDYELANAWVSDSKKWNEVYTVKPFDYMAIIAQHGVPVFNKEKKTYVDKNAIEEKNTEEVKDEDITVSPIDLSVPPKTEAKSELDKVFIQPPTISSSDMEEDDEDDIPF